MPSPVSWIDKSSAIVFYLEGNLVGECRVAKVERDFEATTELNEFLYRVGYFSKSSSTFFKTLIVYDVLKKYHPSKS